MRNEPSTKSKMLHVETFKLLEKKGNLIIEFSSAAFLQFNTCFDQYFCAKSELKLESV